MKKIIIGTLVTFFLVFQAVGQNADPSMGSDLSIRKGALIAVKSYDVKSDTYIVYSVRFPGEGDSAVTPKALKMAIPGLDFERMTSRPNSIVGNQYQLDYPLPTLFEDEVEARIPGKKKSKMNKGAARGEDSAPEISR